MLHHGRLGAPVSHDDKRMVAEQRNEHRDHRPVKTLHLVDQVPVGVVIYRSVQIDELRMQWGSRKLRVVGCGLNHVDDVWPPLEHTDLG
jgi:hypothetical protein